MTLRLSEQEYEIMTKRKAPAKVTKPSRPKMRETALKAACVEYLTMRGCFVWPQNQGALHVENRYVRFAGVDGISDIIGMFPWGQFLAIETKIHPRKATTEQALFLRRVRAHDGAAWLIYDLDELTETFNRHVAERQRDLYAARREVKA